MQLCAKGCHGKFVWAQGEAGEVTWKQNLLRATKLANHIGCGNLPKNTWDLGEYLGKALPVLVLFLSWATSAQPQQCPPAP